MHYGWRPSEFDTITLPVDLLRQPGVKVPLAGTQQSVKCHRGTVDGLHVSGLVFHGADNEWESSPPVGGAVMYLQRGPPIAENNPTTHRTHRTHRTPSASPTVGGGQSLQTGVVRENVWAVLMVWVLPALPSIRGTSSFCSCGLPPGKQTVCGPGRQS
jgi:hypothetical protein